MSKQAFRSLRFVGLAAGLWLVGAILPATPARAAGPTGEIKWGVHVSLATTWFDGSLEFDMANPCTG